MENFSILFTGAGSTMGQKFDQGITNVRKIIKI